MLSGTISSLFLVFLFPTNIWILKSSLDNGLRGNRILLRDSYKWVWCQKKKGNNLNIFMTKYYTSASKMNTLELHLWTWINSTNIMLYTKRSQDKAISINFKNIQNDTSFLETYRRNKTTKKCMRIINTKFKAVIIFRGGRRMLSEQDTQWSPF